MKEGFAPITFERVQEGYRRSGIRPSDGVYARNIKGVPCGCAITAIVVGEGHATFDEIKEIMAAGSGDAFDKIMKEKLGLEHEEFAGFVAGFDAFSFYIGDAEFYKIGLDCRRLLNGGVQV